MVEKIKNDSTKEDNTNKNNKINIVKINNKKITIKSIKTIEKKVLCIFIGFIVTIILSGVLANTLFLEKYYINENKDLFIEYAKQLEKEYRDNNSKFEDYIFTMDKEEGVSITVINPQRNIIFTSRKRNSLDGISRKLRKVVIKNTTTGYYFGVFEDDANKNSNYKIMLSKKLDDGNYLIIRKSVKGIRDSVAIANQFYFIFGGIIILIGGGFAIYFSKKVTKPIVEMSKVAQSIANLDFSKQVEYNAPDELGYLATSINTMSSQLSTSINQLKQDIEHRKQLFRNITHELKTPITVIKGYADGLMYGVVDSKEDMEEYCNTIVLECNQMDSLVHEILNYSELEWSKTTINSTVFQVSQLISELDERYSNVMKSRNIDFRIVNNSTASIRTDFQLLERLLNNYMINAVNHSCLVGDGSQGTYVILEVKENVDSILFTITNSGKPIPESDINNIWNVFYRGTNEQSEGSSHGIGLSIVKTIAGILGFKVGVRNLEEAVCFYVEVPTGMIP